jgi:cell division protein ZapA
MGDAIETIPVVILGKEYKVRCPSGEQRRLQRVAQFVDQSMREVQESGAALGTDRVAVLTALNIANELFQVQMDREAAELEASQRTSRMLEQIQSLIDEADLAQQRSSEDSGPER